MTSAVSKVASPVTSLIASRIGLGGSSLPAVSAPPVVSSPSQGVATANAGAVRKDRLRFAGTAGGIAGDGEKESRVLGGTKPRAATRELLG